MKPKTRTLPVSALSNNWNLVKATKNQLEEDRDGVKQLLIEQTNRHEICRAELFTALAKLEILESLAIDQDRAR
jgi:hypothetical protein